jgi:hypothetical protein
MGRIRSDFKRVVRLLENGQAREALALAQQLVGSSNEDDRLDGYMCLGFVYEDGGVDLEPDFDKSLDNYRRASLMDCARIASGPFIALAIGTRARFQF